MQPVASRGVEGLRGGEGAPPAKAAVTLKNRAPTPPPPTRGGVNKRESLLSGVPPAVSLALTQCGVPPYKTTKRDRARHTLSSRCQSMASPAALQSRLRRAGRTAARGLPGVRGARGAADGGPAAERRWARSHRGAARPAAAAGEQRQRRPPRKRLFSRKGLFLRVWACSVCSACLAWSRMSL